MPSFARPGNWPQPPFSPDSVIGVAGLTGNNNGFTIAVTASGVRQAINLNGATQVELYNAGSSDCAVAFGDATVVAAMPSAGAGNYVIGPGQCKIVTLPIQPGFTVDQITHCHAICAATLTTTLYGFPGVGAS